VVTTGTRSATFARVMPRSLRLAAPVAALALLFAASGPAGAAPKLLMPGVTYERQVQFTAHGPVAIHVMNAPKPGGLWSLRPVLSNGAILGRERVTQMQRTASREATVAGVNGDLFAWEDGRPTGILMQEGSLHHPPTPLRSSIGFAADGTLRVERVRYFGTYRGTGQRRPVDLNQPPNANSVSMFTRAWGSTTPPLDNALEVVLRPFPATAPNVELTGTVAEVKQGSAGGTPIPADGAVITAQGPTAQRLLEEAPLGTAVNVRLVLSPEWTDVPEALGGGPVLVRAGRPVFRHGEGFTPTQLARNPRTAVGQLRDGGIVLVVVDGRRPGYSVGMTNFELAQTLVRLGAVTGSGLDAGGSSTMAFDGALLNRPSDPAGERAVSEGLFVHYAGAYIAPPAEPVLSPNGDGVADVQGFAYKLVRPSRATVTLLGPGGVRREVDGGDKAPGTYRFSWNGLTAANRPEAEGSWRLTVEATDDLGRSSRAHRFFSLNRTPGALRVAPASVPVGRRGGRATARFALTRTARITVTVETAAGVVVAKPAQRSLAAGRHAVVWNGRVAGRSPAHTGRYVLRVAAANRVGTATLAAPFAVRRVAGAR
jgi:hypothetical protein